MNMIPLIAAAALALNPVFVPNSASVLDKARPVPDLTMVAATDGVIADFGTVEFYPNLKSKFGLASNIKRTDIADAGKFINELGPGLMCSNIEFDYFHKAGGSNAALDQTYQRPGDTSSRPTALLGTPSAWLTKHESMLGALNVSQLYQLTGAPPQYLEAQSNVNVHPAPTDVPAAARLIAAWTDASKHPYPVLWSLWNEPGHTLLEFAAEGDQTAPTDHGAAPIAELKAAKKAAKAEKFGGKSGKLAAAAERTDAARTIVDIFAAYSAGMRPLMGPWSQFGLASFISPDFVPVQRGSDGKVFFDSVMDALDPAMQVDFVTFNSFNGFWPVILNGVRAVQGTKPDQGPVIFTQYAPKSLKENPDGSSAKGGNSHATPMQVVLDMVNDLVQMTRATDVKHVCIDYWTGGENGLLDARGKGLVPTKRYAALKMLMDLPAVRTRLDFGTTGLEAKSVRGLAGRSHGKVGVLLWNEGAKPVTVPLVMQGLPASVKAGAAIVTRLDDKRDSAETTAYDGGPIVLPAYGMALVEIAAADIDDPLLRRNSLGTDGIRTRFLQTLSFTDRLAASCKVGLALPKVDGCARNSGTYGFYDSVRSVAYLGMGTGKTNARVTATYDGLPEQIFVNIGIFAIGSAAPANAVQAVATFTTCDSVVKAAPGTDQQGYVTLDLSSVPPDCRAQAGTLTMSLSGVPAGTQAEIYLSNDQAEAQSIASAPPAPLRSDVPDMAEGLVVETKLK